MQTHLNQTNPPNSGSESIRLRWSPPPTDVLMCNSDGAWKEDESKCSFGWILRNHSGEPIYWGAKLADTLLSPLATEGESLVWAIRSVRQLGYKKVIFVSDCEELVIGTTKEKRWASLNTIAQEIEVMAEDFDLFSIRHEKREKNKIADAIAALATSFTSYHSIVSPTSPQPILNLVKAEYPDVYSNFT